jgi:hypothetical protein
MIDIVKELKFRCTNNYFSLFLYLELANKSAFPTNIDKFDAYDLNLDGLLEKNKQWAAAVLAEDPEFFNNIANVQKPKILWIGKKLYLYL